MGVDLLDVYVYWGRPTIIERFFDGKMGWIFFGSIANTGLQDKQTLTIRTPGEEGRFA
jgi:hypothetical protein